MLKRDNYPILEFDDCKEAMLNPTTFGDPLLPSDKLVITFFPEVMQKLRDEGKIRLCRTIDGENPIYVYQFTDDPSVHIIHGTVGCPACAGELDELWGLGIRRVMFCGGGGVLDNSIKVGQLLVVDGAIRDDGFSYHYIPASRYIYSNPLIADKISAHLGSKGVPYLRGLVWTTDALFRETKDRIALRREEGAKIVEMEQSGCLAVSQFRGMSYGAIIYGGDDCASDSWSERNWRSSNSIRYNLVMLCRDIVSEL